jgi:hypothetical protein
MSHQLVVQSGTHEYLEKIHSRLPKDVVDLDCSMRYGDESKYVAVKFGGEFKTIEILHITDVQFGHICCNVPRFREYRDWILAKPNRFTVWGGDMVDAAHALSVASPYENTVEPQQQVFRFVEEAAPMRHRVIGYVGGNHERRSSRMFGDLGHLIATFLKIPYSSGKQFIDIHYGDHKPFKMSLWHGGTGSRTKGAKAQMLHRFMGQADSQLYMVGHLHDAILLFDWREKRKGRQIALEKIAGVMSSSFLEHYGTYAEVAGLCGADTMMWRCILEPTGKWELTAR